MKNATDSKPPVALLSRSPVLAGVAVLVIGLALATPAMPTASDSTQQVRLEVSSFRSTKGTLICRLFAETDIFPDGDGVASEQVAILGGNASCVFLNVMPGVYAAAVVHDENGNGRLDKNLIGIPKEGYGVSNNHTYTMSSPKWVESRFVVAPGETATLRVVLRY